MEVDTTRMRNLTGGRFVESACSADTVSLYSIHTCYWAGKSAVCDIVIAESPVYGKILFLDNEIQSAESDEAIYHEHLIHPVLAATAATKAKRVLIVGGGEGATAREVLKWSADDVARVDWVDIDGDLVRLCRRHLSWADDAVYNDARLTYTAEDIRTFLHRCEDGAYDVIVLDLPDPDVDALRAVDPAQEEPAVEYALYGKKFWSVMRAKLAPHGAIVTHAGPIAPGGEDAVRREGLTWIEASAATAGFRGGAAYHVCIPSFQGEWGFWMSVPPCADPAFPTNLIIMSPEAQRAAFTWLPYWRSPYFGFVGAGTGSAAT
jgi:spermidine synthase